MLTADTLRGLLSYDPETGVFRRLVRTSNRVNVGDIAGNVGTNGYRYIRVGGGRYLAHRLAWLHVHGSWPTHEIDHRHRVKDDCRLTELRPATKSENNCNKGPQPNNRSGHKGVHWDADRGKWFAQIEWRNIKFNLGRHETLAAACQAYSGAARTLHGDFAGVV